MRFLGQILYNRAMRKISWLLTIFLAVSVINYPNPVSPSTGQVVTFEYTADTTREAFLYIYDMSAKLFLKKSVALAGGTTSHTSWNGYSDYNQLVSNGLYLYQIISPGGQRLGRGKIWVINQ
ncbi:hypothetical protein COT42_08680 [Candidatus Saganbacteria bacterium CG08_land_8_20_14_0_20_45_16]|uniref:FlgD Ig-like domain-containing protein n=1 Tax=Candidatus Saganbacteria bacterium CG08_land_8_20_14_0_20_45_16 TaxID=2014293 RepID=A0A2H0XTK0_UNCSA|nr:MAG: hypothetical protein COT42_08680 [Candidatus Saganbacteria bacterium CG08_land_8_20_14_0_20_45_16]